eukprot:4902540-Amphidinium_carterae.1
MAAVMPVPHDARGRLSRQVTNLDAFQVERDRLLQQLRDIPESDVAGKQRRTTLFNRAFSTWPIARFLKGLEPETGFLYW